MTSLLKPKFLIYGMMVLLYSMILLIIKPQEPAVFFLWIFSATIMVLRLRFGFMSKWIILDFIIYSLWMLFNDSAYIFMIPSLSLLIYESKNIYILLYIVIFAIFAFIDVQILLVMLLSITLSLLLSVWNKDSSKSIHMIDQLRDKIYQSEIEREQLLEEHHEISRLSILSERDRIAQKLHDDLGHELTGALLALRAYESKHKSSLEDTSFQVLKMRLENSVNSLKSTVHHTRPEEDYGLERFKQLIEQIDISKVEFKQNGMIEKVKVIHWQLLISILKEAITNIQKHARPNIISIELNIQDTIIRFLVSNDGIIQSANHQGVGLRYMRKRVEAMGGTMSVQKTLFFKLLVVLPVHREEGN